MTMNDIDKPSAATHGPAAFVPTPPAPEERG